MTEFSPMSSRELLEKIIRPVQITMHNLSDILEYESVESDESFQESVSDEQRQKIADQISVGKQPLFDENRTLNGVSSNGHDIAESRNVSGKAPVSSIEESSAPNTVTSDGPDLAKRRNVHGDARTPAKLGEKSKQFLKEQSSGHDDNTPHQHRQPILRKSDKLLQKKNLGSPLSEMETMVNRPRIHFEVDTEKMRQMNKGYSTGDKSENSSAPGQSSEINQHIRQTLGPSGSLHHSGQLNVEAHLNADDLKMDIPPRIHFGVDAKQMRQQERRFTNRNKSQMLSEPVQAEGINSDSSQTSGHAERLHPNEQLNDSNLKSVGADHKRSESPATRANVSGKIRIKWADRGIAQNPLALNRQSGTKTVDDRADMSDLQKVVRILTESTDPDIRALLDIHQNQVSSQQNQSGNLEQFGPTEGVKKKSKEKNRTKQNGTAKPDRNELEYTLADILHEAAMKQGIVV